MFRTVLAIATTASALMAFASTAQACLSCEYVPEVVREHSTFNAKRHKVPAYVAAQGQRARPAAPVVKAAPRRIETASVEKAKPAAKAEDKTSAETSNTKVTSSSLALLKSETEAAAPAVAKPEIETASTAPPAAEEPQVAAPKVSEPVGCKRFIPAVGVTLSVACD